MKKSWDRQTGKIWYNIYGSGREEKSSVSQKFTKTKQNFFGKRFAELIAEAGTASGRCKDIGGGRQTLPPFSVFAFGSFAPSKKQ